MQFDNLMRSLGIEDNGVQKKASVKASATKEASEQFAAGVQEAETLRKMASVLGEDMGQTMGKIAAEAFVSEVEEMLDGLLDKFAAEVEAIANGAPMGSVTGSPINGDEIEVHQAASQAINHANVAMLAAHDAANSMAQGDAHTAQMQLEVSAKHLEHAQAISEAIQIPEVHEHIQAAAAAVKEHAGVAKAHADQAGSGLEGTVEVADIDDQDAIKGS